MFEKKPKAYLDVVANAFSTVQAWRSAAFLLGALAAFLAYELVHQSQNTPVVLVPYDLAANGTNMKVVTNGEIRGTSVEYLANIAMADLGLILNFTPDNVITQHRRFLNRVTEDLYGQQSAAMLAQADDLKKKGVTQSFYTSDVRVKADGSSVEVEGTQIRYTGGKEMLRSTLTYIISYKVYKGYMHVADLRQKTDAK
ncbi:MAG: TraE/TraK family type IV conjugative transfer system protein [Agitococcus sp.]|nr:TraE/TraK family type IV conjugative transfer system protein [Agitococcus sp.]MDO9176998.1 TraE/TraK family type IV conjugative transfer system protein [Agitococcus sp.]